jgi:hypothetical protein
MQTKVFGQLFLALSLSLAASQSADARKPKTLTEKLTCAHAAQKKTANMSGEEEMKIWENCWDSQDLQALGEAHVLISWAETICGGRFSPLFWEVDQNTGGVHSKAYNDAADLVENTNKERLQQLEKNKVSAEADRFCRGVADSFGPKGSRFPGLYQP